MRSQLPRLVVLTWAVLWFWPARPQSPPLPDPLPRFESPRPQAPPARPRAQPPQPSGGGSHCYEVVRSSILGFAVPEVVRSGVCGISDEDAKRKCALLLPQQYMPSEAPSERGSFAEAAPDFGEYHYACHRGSRTPRFGN